MNIALVTVGCWLFFQFAFNALVKTLFMLDASRHKRSYSVQYSLNVVAMVIGVTMVLVGIGAVK